MLRAIIIIILLCISDVYAGERGGSGSGSSSLNAIFSDYRSNARVYRVDGDNIGVEAGCLVIGSEARVNSSAITNITYTAPDNYDWLDVWAGTDGLGEGFAAQAVDSGTSPGGTTNPYTNGRLIGSIFYQDSSQKITIYRNYMMGRVEGWDWISGNGSSSKGSAISLGVTMSNASYMLTTNYLGKVTSGEPTVPSASITDPAGTVSCTSRSATTTAFNVYIRKDSGTWPSSNKLVIGFIASGDYSL